MSMNIPPHIPQVVVNSAAPSTEALAKANAVKEVIPASVKTEATVPQKSREQEARSPAENTTYDNIRSNIEKDIIPEDESQSGNDDGSQQESAQQEQANQEASEQSDSESTQASQSSEQAEVKQQEAAEQKVVDQLQQRDREVKAHEQAHAAIGGALAGAPSYQYQTGPDGKRYAVGGEVSIDVSKESDPEDTIRKMQTVQAAALAPAEPSSQDRKVAAQAAKNISEARAEIISESSSLSNSGELEQSADTETTVSVNSQETDDNVERSSNGQTETALAQTYNAQDNVNKTAQVVSQKYASSFQTKEVYFSAVA